MTLQTAVERRCITEVVHFTTNHGIVGALECRHLLSRPYLQENKHLRHVLKLNALVRPEEFALFDESEDWVRFVNLSISEINKRFLTYPEDGIAVRTFGGVFLLLIHRS